MNSWEASDSGPPVAASSLAFRNGPEALRSLPGLALGLPSPNPQEDAMDTGSAGKRTRSDINVTPLIDIVLVLLIVFIVMVPSLNKALDVNVPIIKDATVDTPKPPQEPVVLSLDQSGKLFLQKDEIQLSQVADLLTPVVKLQPYRNRKVFLKVDEDLPNQRAVDVLDQIRVASERAKRDSLVLTPTDNGGEVKVAISLKKRV
jgi:biopolymer transport protein ExbD